MKPLSCWQWFWFRMQSPTSLLRVGFLAFAFSISCASFSFAQTNDSVISPGNLKKLSFEELLNIDVISVSKRPEKLSETASAIQVITGEEIHRSGATTLPEALRLASNLEVAQVDAHQWSISARGFNSPLANKLLVMIDGRTVYTPLYAGVYWDVQNVLLEDLDRIEVVSGPGGTLWGANAVNGVINVISKSARDTQGTLLTGSGGSYLQDLGAVRYGDHVGTNFFYRIYGQRTDHDSSVFPNGHDSTNSWDMTQGGFRTDWYASEINTLTFQGDFYAGTFDQPARTIFTTNVIRGEAKVDGQNILGRWTHIFSDDSDLKLQLYFDRTWRSLPNSTPVPAFPNPFAQEVQTFDVDLQHHFPLGERQSFVWGGGYRLMQDRVQSSPGQALIPSHRDLQLFSGFVQDEIILAPDHLRFTVGTKIEHNDFSGFEIQPSARIAWTPDDRQTVWAAVSRAVRSPSRVDGELVVPFAALGTNVGPLVTNPEFDSEKLLAYEVGYRVKPLEKLSLSASAYYDVYEDLRSLDVTTTNTFVLGNHFEGEIWGLELAATYEAAPWWRLRGGYNYLQKHLRPTSPMANSSAREGNDPQHQFSLQSLMDLSHGFQLDVSARYVAALPNPEVMEYFTFDVRLAWQYRNWEFAVVGQNLWDNRHPEFGDPLNRQEIPRSVYGKVTWRF